MTLLVIGADPGVMAGLASLAARAGGLRVTDADSAASASRRPDWVLTATAAQRGEAIERFRLAPFRVVALAALADRGAFDREAAAIEVALRRMHAIGAPHPLASPAGVALARMVVRRLMLRSGLLLEPDPVQDVAPMAARADRRSTQRAAAAAASAVAAPVPAPAGIGLVADATAPADVPAAVKPPSARQALAAMKRARALEKARRFIALSRHWNIPGA